eukprot:6487608-Amphidinium_carterae.1
MSPRPEDVTGHGDPTAGYTAQSAAAPSAIPAIDLASIPQGIASRGRSAVSNHQLFSQNSPSPTNTGTPQVTPRDRATESTTRRQ